MIPRREKKCFLGSALFHAALLVVLLVGPAFLSSKPPPQSVINYIPDEVVDAALSRGGTPRPTPAAALPAAPTPPQRAEPVSPPEPPQPKPPVKASEPEPVPDPPKPLPRTETFKVSEKKAPPKKTASTPAPPKKSQTKVNTTVVIRNADQNAKQKAADLKATEDAAKKLRDTISQTAKNLRNGLSESVSVEVTSGPGGGGPSVANWAQVVHGIYDRAWIEPSNATDGRTTAKATITIAKDGSVVSASLTSPSGNAALDQSIRTVLDRVREVPAFPAGAREERRTITIKFNLLGQRLPG